MRLENAWAGSSTKCLGICGVRRRWRSILEPYDKVIVARRRQKPDLSSSSGRCPITPFPQFQHCQPSHDDLIHQNPTHERAHLKLAIFLQRPHAGLKFCTYLPLLIQTYHVAPIESMVTLPYKAHWVSLCCSGQTGPFVGASKHAHGGEGDRVIMDDQID